MYGDGDLNNPDHSGSGGGGSNVFGCQICLGGNGGGLVRIVADTIALNGRISANGGAAPTASEYTGSGAGGGIRIDTRVLSGSGFIEANGGNHTGTSGGSAGAGGSIAVWYEDVSGFDLSKITAKPGDAAATNSTLDAGAGTVFLFDELNDTHGSLIVDSRGNSPAGVTPLRAIGPANSTGLSANTLTRSTASFPVANASTRAAELVGLELNPNTAQGQTFTVTDNIATTITTDPADGAMTSVRAAGNPFVGVYTFDT